MGQEAVGEVGKPPDDVIMKDAEKPTLFNSWCSECDLNKGDSSATGNADALTKQEKENLYTTCRVLPNTPHTGGDADDQFSGL